ncbi:archaellin/type IV pilin N-terminal domain-containing protein [Halorubrum rutilum]|uniref:Flagellin n=1 Tax=Halorubrum rutilum TaxID=1364933 RepID=A0ABD6AHS0_9EURY|nr:archaellin/type IV pilin N-terminal domain-containing protein [Halorubrum rutilum]
MFESLLNKEERGQVGIGTLIVFIAMVLVAAIAAGVLINTAGFLQTQAEATGQESTEQVSNNLKVESVVSEVESGPQINAIAIDVSLAPGSDPIDITSATLEWIGSGDSKTFSITAADPSQDSSSLDPVIVDNQKTELTSTGETARIYILSGTQSKALDLGTNAGSGAGTGSGVSDFPLTGGAEADITITSPSGGQTTATVRVPDVLVSGEGVRL